MTSSAPSGLSRTIASLVIGGAILLVTTTRLHGANTAAGTTISNQATVSFQVGGVSQTPVDSNTYAFVVDRKVNLTVVTTDIAAVQVSPGTLNKVLRFTVENTGNGVQDFALSAVARSGGTGAFGGTDNKDAAGVVVRVESGATGGYQSGEDTATYIDELAAGGTATVYIVADFSPLTYVNGDIASYHLVAEARAHGTAASLGGALTQTDGADTPGVEDIVFADGQGSATANDAARDAKFSDDSDYIITAAVLSAAKSSAVVSDPTNNTTNPKAIPGAVVEYTITVSNGAGAATASNISFSDSLATEVTAGTLAFNSDSFGSGQGVQVTAPNINGGAAKAITNVGSDDEGDWNVTAGNTVTVTGIQLQAGETATIKFRVTVQ